MTKLSVNLNKVALVRNSRGHNQPDLMEFARLSLESGAHGLTLHPRPDQRHATPEDVRNLTALCREHDGIEMNVEGNPFDEFMDLVCEVVPDQVTLVPDEPGQLTSDHGWTVSQYKDILIPLISRMKDKGIRVSIFMDPVIEEIELVPETGADRIELYTEPYASAFPTEKKQEVFEQFAAAAKCAEDLGLGLNAGHDLDLENLPLLCSIPNLKEVSIGHALVVDALRVGFAPTVKAYLHAIEKGNQ